VADPDQLPPSTKPAVPEVNSFGGRAGFWWRSAGQALVTAVGCTIMLGWESTWRDRPYLLALSLSLTALVIGPWPLALLNEISLSLLSFYLFIQPYHTWGIATQGELDYTILYGIFLVGLNTAWWLNSRSRRRAVADRATANQDRADAQRDRDLLGHILASNPAAVVTLNPDGVVLYANQRATELMGVWIGARQGVDFGGDTFERESLDGQPLPPSEGPFRKVLRTGQATTFPRYRFRRRGHSWRIIDAYAAPIRSAGGSLEAVVVSIIDVTDAYEADQRLRAQQETLERIAASVPGVVFQYQPRRDHSPDRFLYVSPRSFDYLGLTPADLHDAEALWPRIHPTDLPGVIASVRAAVSSGTGWQSEFRVQHPSRGVLWLRGDATATTLPGGASVWNGIWLDITSQKQLEMELLHAQKVEMVGQLAGGVAHDFNNILAAILGCAEAFELEANLDATATEDLADLKRSVDRGAALTSQLLAFSRKQIVMPTHVDLNHSLKDVEKLVRRLLGAHITLVVIPGEAPGVIFADPGQIQQVLLNLIINARDAMPNGGRVVVRILSDSGDGAPAGNWVVLEVADTGQGMSREVQEQIFEPFFTTKAPGKGTGLGLATVQGIVTQAGGRITVESTLGAGTTFRIYLPAAATEPQPGQRPSGERRESPRGSRRGTILLVEDEESVRRILRRMLQEEGYALTEARHGDEALALYQARKKPIDILVTDVVMPGMSGPALADALRSEQPDLPVLFLSGFVSESIEASTKNDPRHRLLPKPFHREAILEALDALTAVAR
jgi:signal transduction histidine kinase/CheY-like chemotaxis protein